MRFWNIYSGEWEWEFMFAVCFNIGHSLNKFNNIFFFIISFEKNVNLFLYKLILNHWSINDTLRKIKQVQNVEKTKY